MKNVLLVTACVMGTSYGFVDTHAHAVSAYAQTAAVEYEEHLSPSVNRIVAHTLFDEKMKEAFNHCVTLHRLDRAMTEQEKQICEKIFSLMCTTLKDNYFYARSVQQAEQNK